MKRLKILSLNELAEKYDEYSPVDLENYKHVIYAQVSLALQELVPTLTTVQFIVDMYNDVPYFISYKNNDLYREPDLRVYVKDSFIPEYLSRIYSSLILNIPVINYILGKGIHFNYLSDLKTYSREYEEIAPMCEKAETVKIDSGYYRVVPVICKLNYTKLEVPLPLDKNFKLISDKEAEKVLAKYKLLKNPT